ncbi:conjugal transfer protein TraG N-terminal domain-containing protein [Candidatus Manganitrophus noduliformans]|uniref:Conjugal transfer protein TraG n=1 Tax=Candidatus Manganitrophus noduliformans TaxID=2606439 RepID=A0A7X6DNI6_9BACT|nr:conjugal transfer protein TraG N-terminal domain-containing protein [Candidatus Manganitrophus noduliformans]NKE70173.1 conjugal transfer protein TraG [Candidatus Manganitrophus noduliformans]
MKKSFHVPPLVFLVVILSHSTSHAIEMEYYTYNGFNAVVSAFTKIALIFSDADYKGLFFTVIVLGILMGGVVVYFLALSGARVTPLSWTWPVGIGITLYLALVLPKGTLHIYDPVKNQYQPVGGIPDGLVALIGALNKVERGLIDIVSNAADPVGYQQQAGGVGFDMLLNIQSKGVLLSDQYIHLSLRKYVEDCLYFEVARPGTTLTINDLANNADFIPLFRKGASPAIYTTFYEDAKPEGRTLKCSEAMPAIEAKITNPSLFENTSQARCADAGFDPSIPSEYNQCKGTFTSLVNWVQGAVFDATQIYRQNAMAQSLSSVAQLASPDTAIAVLAGRDTGTSLLSTGVVANEWIPIIRAVITAIAIGLLPFLVIFIPTPLFGKAVTLIAGFFIWLTAWGVTDAIAHQFAIDYAVKAFAEVRQYQLGLTAISTFGTASLKTLAAFGAIRWSGLMLATVITTMLVRFGGHALSMLAGEITGSPRHAAQAAGRVATPEGAADIVSALENAPPVMANAYRFDFGQRTHARANTMAKSTGEGLGLVDADSAFEVGGIQGQSARGSAYGTKQFASDVAGGDVVSASMQSQYFRQSSLYGESQGRFDLARQLLGIRTPTEAAAFNTTGRTITPEMAAVASKQGYKGVIPGMHLTEIGFDPKSGKAASISFAGPVTEGNIDAVREVASNAGHQDAASMLKPGMIASYSIDPQSGKGTFNATDTTSVKSEDFAEKTFSAGKGLTVDTPYGSYQLRSGKVQQVGGQLYINGTSEDGRKIALEGSLRDAYRLIPGIKQSADGTAYYSTDPDAVGYELQMKAVDHGEDGDLRTGVMKDRDGNITGIGLNLTRAQIEGGVHGYETLNSEELKGLAKTLRSQGGSNQAVNTLEYLADRGMSANVQYSYPAHGGKMGQLAVTNEKTGKTMDFALSQSGWEEISKAHSSSLSGSRNISEDIDKSTVDHGVGIGSAMQMALNRDPAIARFVSDHTLAKYKPETFDANVAATAKDLARDVGGFLKRNGASVGYAEGSAGLRVFGIGGAAGRKSIEEESNNLLATEYDQRIRQSVGEAKEQELGRDDTERYVAGKVGEFTQGLYDQARTASSLDYGASAPGAGVRRAIESIPFDPKRIDVDELKNRPD